MLPFEPQIRFAARRAARRTGLLVAGALLVAGGVIALTIALYIQLASTHGGVFAAGVIGAIYLGLGLIILAIASRPPTRSHYSGDEADALYRSAAHTARRHQKGAAFPPLTEAFIFGLTTAMQMKGRKK